MNLFAISGLLISIPCFILGIFTFFKGRSKQHYLWAAFSFSVAVWGLGGYIIANITDQSQALFWWRLTYVGVILIPILLAHFVAEFLQLEKRGLIIFGYLVTAVFLFFNLGSDLFINQVRFVFGQFYYLSDPTVLYNLFVVWFFLLVAYCHFKLIQSYRVSCGFLKEQIRYVLIAMIVGFAGGVCAFLPVYYLDIYPAVNVAIFISPFIVAYAILRYRLMDIRLAVRKIYIYLGLILFAYSIFYLIVFVEELLFGSVYAGNALIFGVIVAIVFVLTYEIFLNLLSRSANRYLFPDLYNYQEVIKGLAGNLNNFLDLSDIFNMVSGTVSDIFNIDKLAILSIDETDRRRLSYSKIIGFKRINCLELLNNSLLMDYLEANRLALVVDELLHISQQTKNKLEIRSLIGLKKFLNELEIAVVLPLMSDNKLSGLIILGNKTSGDAFTREDISILNAVAGQLSMAIENARLYKKEQKFNVKLKEEIKKATAKLEAANKELQRLDDAKSEFLSIASHQLRTPTTIIKGYISMMQEGSFGKVPKVVKQNLDKVHIATERLLSLIENLLDISRIEAGRLEFNFEPVDLLVIAKELKDEFKTKVAEKKLQLNVYGTKNLAKVSTDIVKVKEVASNLVDNAVKYTQKGEINIDLHQEGTSVVFSVSDTGIGIAPEDVGRLFNKFVRGQGMTTVHPEGTGLGLYFARVVIENLGGRIWAESVGRGKGSKFSFSLPLADKKKAKKVSS
jgi:signal transduction histidine kinase